MNGAKIAFGTFVIVLFGALLTGYSLIMTSAPVTIAQAQVAVIEARSDAIIEQMYAAENVAKLAQARERNETTAQVILGMTVGALAVIVMLAVVIMGAVSWQRVHQVGGRRDVCEIDGVKYRMVGQRGDWIEIEPISQYELAERRMK